MRPLRPGYPPSRLYLLKNRKTATTAARFAQQTRYVILLRMNLLAHLHLARPTAESRLGNILPDLVRGRLPAALPPEVQAGVSNHRRVDAFTDTHPLFSRSRARLRPRHGIFSGLLVDVFYDHFLAARWSAYHALPLPRFIERVYGDLTDPATHPPPLRAAAERHDETFMPARLAALADQDWLGHYATLAGIERTLQRMERHLARRTGRAVALSPAVEDLERHYDALGADFAGFFPRLRRYIGHRETKEAGQPTEPVALPRTHAMPG